MNVFREIALDLIDAPRGALRAGVCAEEVRALAESIREVGLLQPLGVVEEGGRFRVRYGHRRLLACQWLRLSPVPCMVIQGDGALHAADAAAENVVRRDLSAVEEARAIRGLVDERGLRVEEVAASLGKSQGWVRQRLEMLRWPEEFLLLVERGELVVSVARELVQVEDDRVREHYTRCAVESGCTAAQARAWRREWELTAEPGRAVDAAEPLRPPPTAAVVPRAPCHVCEEGFEITALGIVRICGRCAAILTQTKEEEKPVGQSRVDTSADGGGEVESPGEAGSAPQGIKV